MTLSSRKFRFHVLAPQVLQSGIPNSHEIVLKNMVVALDRIFLDVEDPFVFSSYHKALRKPFDCYDFGQKYIRLLIDFRKMKAALAAFDTTVDCSMTFFDIAEVYGSKERKVKHLEMEVAVTTKYAALPWRLGSQSALNCLKDSLSHLELSSVELYQLNCVTNEIASGCGTVGGGFSGWGLVVVQWLCLTFAQPG
ncbi:unnamed protein product [Dovyalis caffra]|uniref:glycerol-3-phosphate 1-O-acyltransferase n=1 Tax=Dovyalis caffra TaxID=77055 RepID=A0AAV1RHW3_9ROSI|nr:unnamed protein product [Dovyalis caffra]